MKKYTLFSISAIKNQLKNPVIMKIPGVHTCIFLFSLIIISALTFGCQKEDPVELPALDTIEVTEITAKTAKRIYAPPATTTAALSPQG